MKKEILIQNGGFEPSEIRRVRLLAIQPTQRALIEQVITVDRQGTNTC